MTQVMHVRSISVGEISPNRFQPRKRFDDSTLKELAASIKSNGLLQPVTVRPIKDGSTPFELVLGERRLRSTILNGESTINGIVREMSDNEAREIAIIENVQRESLSPMEEAQSVRDLVETNGGSKDIAADKLKKTVTWVYGKLNLLTLPVEIQAMIDEKKLNDAQAKVILEIPGSQKQLEAAKKAYRLNLSANSLRGMVQQDMKPKRERTTLGDERRQISHASLVSLLTRAHDGIESFDIATIGDGEPGRKKRDMLVRQLKLVREKIIGFEQQLETHHVPDIVVVPKLKPAGERPRLTIKKFGS